MSSRLKSLVIKPKRKINDTRKGNGECESPVKKSCKELRKFPASRQRSPLAAKHKKKQQTEDCNREEVNNNVSSTKNLRSHKAINKKVVGMQQGNNAKDKSVFRQKGVE